MITRNLEGIERQKKEIQHHIHRQILGLSDQVRSKEIWQKILAAVDPETLASVLSTQLTHFNYQEVATRKHCKCCR